MNISGDDPGQDDYGLPPVDIVIPDDARELDSDLHAYRREQRARRRRRASRRLRSPRIRDRMVLPLLAGFLALALLAAALLAVFVPGRGPSGTAGTSQSAAPGRVGAPLPNANVLVGGEETPLQSLTAAVLALIPPHCQCQTALATLTRQAQGIGANVYVVGIDGEQVTSLTRSVGLRATHAVQDTGNVLVTYYRPNGFTAILVRASGSVSAVIPVKGHGAELAKALRSLPTSTARDLGPGGSAPLAAAPAAPQGP